MPDYQKLLLSAAKALKLEDDLALLKALEAMAANWEKLATHLDGVASLEALASKVADDLKSPQMEAAFKAAGLEDAYKVLTAQLGRITALIPAKYQGLLKPLSSFKAGDTAAVVDWSLAASDVPLVKSSRYALDLGAQATISLDAGAAWPAEGIIPPKLLKIAADGSIKADAKATLPYVYGAVQAGGSLSATTALAYYFDAPDAIFAGAVASRLGELPDPFDLASVWAAFTTTDLDAISFNFNGAASADVQVSFGDTRAIGDLVASLNATVAVSTSLTSVYRLTLRRDVGPAGWTLATHLSRDRVQEAKFNGALTLGVDISTLTKPVVDALTRVGAQWDAALAGITPYLSPGTLLRDKFVAELTQQLTALIGQPGLRDAVLADLKGALGLGTPSDSKIVGWLIDQVTGAIDRGSVLVEGQVSDGVDRVMASLGGAAPILLQTDAAGALKTLVNNEVNKLETGLKTAVQDLLKIPGDQLKTLLQQAGAQVSGAVASADDALKAVRDLLDRYDKTFHDFLKVAEDAAKAKVTARLYDEETKKDEVVAEVVGAFTAVDPESSAVFKALTRGTLQSLVRLVEQPQDVAGFKLARDASSVTRFSAKHSEQGLELVFLNITASFKEMIDGSATVKLNALGDVQVDSAGSDDKTVTLPWETRQVSFVDAQALVVAAKADQIPAGPPRFEIGIGASYTDKTMRWGDVQGFIQSLADANLVGPQVMGSAQAAFAAWSAEAAMGGRINGSVSASMRLNGAALRTLLRLPHLTPAGLDQETRRAIVKAAVDVTITRKAIDKKSFIAGAATAMGRFSPTTISASIEDIVLDWPTAIKGLYAPKAGVLPTDDTVPLLSDLPSSAATDYLYFLRQAFALGKLVELIQTMGDVYTSVPSVGGAPGWTEQQYQRAQSVMAEASTYWLIVAPTLVSLFSSDVSRRTTAFMRVIADLSGLPPVGDVVVTMTYNPKAGAPQTAAFG